MHHVGKPRNKSVFLDNPHGFFGRKLAVEETLEDLRLSRQRPTIEEHVLRLVLGNSLKRFQEELFYLIQGVVLPRCIYTEKARFKMCLVEYHCRRRRSLDS